MLTYTVYNQEFVFDSIFNKKKGGTMKNRIAILSISSVLLIALSFNTALTANRSVSKKYLQQLYVNFLTEEGYRPEIDSDGDVRFKHDGKILFIGVSESDANFFRIVLPNIWKIENDTERRKVLAAVDYSNAKSKVSKAYILNNNVWVAIEMFVGDPEGFTTMFTRCLAALMNGKDNFVVKMRE